MEEKLDFHGIEAIRFNSAAINDPAVFETAIRCDVTLGFDSPASTKISFQHDPVGLRINGHLVMELAAVIFDGKLPTMSKFMAGPPKPTADQCLELRSRVESYCRDTFCQHLLVTPEPG